MDRSNLPVKKKNLPSSKDYSQVPQSTSKLKIELSKKKKNASSVMILLKKIPPSSKKKNDDDNNKTSNPFDFCFRDNRSMDNNGKAAKDISVSLELEKEIDDSNQGSTLKLKIDLSKKKKIPSLVIIPPSSKKTN